MSIIEELMQYPYECTKTNSDNCTECSRRICCVVFMICATSQGREGDVIKGWSVPCEHLSERGDCTIYAHRDEYPGYKESCEGFTCSNTGPLLSEWMDRNSLSFDSDGCIGSLLRVMQGFVTKGNRYDERYKFLQDVILKRYTNTEDLLKLFGERHGIENEFQRWARENPEDPEFDRKLLTLFAQE